tara:strand:- start:332 stop:1273 length:942 start_codon:yes stop_codon:yes gene_type:complete
MRWVKQRKTIATLSALVALAGCMPTSETAGPSRAIAPQPAIYTPSDSTLALARYYGNLQADLLTQGLLRTDGGGVDTPYSARQLAQNYETIAFYDEYESGSWKRRQDGAPSKLRRWSVPVKVAVEFGNSVPVEQRQLDGTNVRLFAERLARVTNHPIRMAPQDSANFNVLFMGYDDHGQMMQRLRQIVPQMDPGSFRVIETMPRSTHCLMLSYSAKHNAHDIRHSIVVIRAEHPDILRKSCVHEEMAQGLGLINDSLEARPSIFNDNDEFAFLTTHDEQLLRMHYDPRLHIGMGLEEARPIIAQLAREATGGS